MPNVIINDLIARKKQLVKQLSNVNANVGSKIKRDLIEKIEALNALISIYQKPPSSSLSLQEAKDILDQQFGFEEMKTKVSNFLEADEYRRSEGLKTDKFPTLCFVGPAGVGKTTSSQYLAQALNKEIFTLALNGISDSSFLLGTDEEMGQLTKALIKAKNPDPLILLDEIDKVVGSSFRGSSIHNCLLSVLDSSQNQSILDPYLDVRLDFSQVTFAATANSFKASNPSENALFSRMLIVPLLPYTEEQKKEIIKDSIKEWLKKNEFSDQDLEFTEQALTCLVSKSKEEGVRQLKEFALKNILEYC